MRRCVSIGLLFWSANAAAGTVASYDFRGNASPIDQALPSGFIVYSQSLSSASSVPRLPASPPALPETATAPMPVSPCSETALPPIVPGLKLDVHLRRTRYWALVRAAECRVGLPAGLLDALILAESRYAERARSPVGAAGLTQLMPATARDLGISDRDDPLLNIDGGARYLRARIDQFGSVALGIAAYNAGPGAVLKAGGIPLNRETPTYVRRVFDYWNTTRFIEATTAVAEQLRFTGSSPE